MNNKATLGVIDQTKILLSLINADDIHKTNRVDYISADFAINLNECIRDAGVQIHSTQQYLWL